MESNIFNVLAGKLGPLAHVRAQGATLAAMAQVALRSVDPRQPRGGLPLASFAPGPRLRALLPPPEPALVRDFVSFLGGEPADWRGEVPPLLFPQWTFPLLARTLAPLPIPAMKLLNGGFRMEVMAPLPAGEALEVEAWLSDIVVEPRKTTFVQEVVTGTASSPGAVRVRFFPVLPTRGLADGAEGAAQADGLGPMGVALPPIPPEGVRTIATLDLPRRAGLDFAALTGDFNPIHWLPPVARLSGFPNVILHGFASFGLAFTHLSGVASGGPRRRVRAVAARFNRPLVLPARAEVMTDGEGGLWLGPGPGEKSWMSGRVDFA
jgi:acyl dehydratase